MRTVTSDRRFPVAVVALMAVLVSGRTPDYSRTRNDPQVYLDTVHRMRGGSGYYAAMDASLRALGLGPVESTRAFRLPTWFALARWAPSDRALWWAFLIVVVIGTVAVVSRLVDHPAAAIGAGVILLFVGLDGYTFPDVWSVPLVALGLLAATRQRWWLAALAVGAATGVREVAALALVGLAAEMWTRGRCWLPLAPAVVGIAVVALLHSRAVEPFLVPAGQGREAQLIGSSHGLRSVADMASVWVPGRWAVGLPLYGLALWQVRRSGHLTLIGPWLALPLIGLVVHRQEWGALVVPFAAAFGIDGVVGVLAARHAPAPAVAAEAEALR